MGAGLWMLWVASMNNASADKLLLAPERFRRGVPQDARTGATQSADASAGE